jgi:hypothetical protein
LGSHSGREADYSPPSSAEVKEWVELYLHSSNTPSWRGAQREHRGSTFGPIKTWILQGPILLPDIQPHFLAVSNVFDRKMAGPWV